MLLAPLIALALAGASDDCDLRATIAGELMILHQSGSSRLALAAAAGGTRMPDFAAGLVARVLAAETSPDTSARELAAYHFSAEVYAECILPGAQLSASAPGASPRPASP
jgi:hypothetical protein